MERGGWGRVGEGFGEGLGKGLGRGLGRGWGRGLGKGVREGGWGRGLGRGWGGLGKGWGGGGLGKLGFYTSKTPFEKPLLTFPRQICPFLDALRMAFYEGKRTAQARCCNPRPFTDIPFQLRNMRPLYRSVPRQGPQLIEGLTGPDRAILRYCSAVSHVLWLQIGRGDLR